MKSTSPIEFSHITPKNGEEMPKSILVSLKKRLFLRILMQEVRSFPKIESERNKKEETLLLLKKTVQKDWQVLIYLIKLKLVLSKKDNT